MNMDESVVIEIIKAAISQHDASCPYPAQAVLCNPATFISMKMKEIDQINLESDLKVKKGKFIIKCQKEHY